MVSTKVLVIIGLVLLNTMTSYGMPRQLMLSQPIDKVINPVQQILNRTPQTITEKFTDELMKELDIIRHHCEEMETNIHLKMEHKLQNLSDYQEYINDIVNKQYTDMSDKDIEKIQYNFQMAFEKLFTEEENDEAMISVKCTEEFKNIMNDKMTKALNYAENLLNDNTTQFVSFISDVIQYNNQLDNAMKHCINNYQSTVNDPLMKGSSSYECKQIEIQILTHFVYRFIIQSAKLFSGQNTFVDEDIFDMLPELFPRAETNEEPTIYLRPILEGLPQSQDTPNNSLTSDHNNVKPHPSHNNQQPHPSHNSEKPYPSQSSEKPRPSHNNQWPLPSQQPRPSSSSSNGTGQFNIHIISGINPHHSIGIIMISGIISIILFVLIIIIGIIIITIKYRKHTTKNWSQLTEEEKITTMKKSGYVNPTYEFFDKVTQ